MSRMPQFSAPAPAPIPTLSVGELTGLIKESLEEGFSDVAVHGEISNLARPKSGHVYCALKDASAQIRMVLWKGVAENLVFDLQDGLAVRAWGRVTVYPARGEYQLVVRKIEPEGVGALELAFRQLYARLDAEGLFDPARKRRLPSFPRRIALVTSPTGAAVHDFLQVLSRRWRDVEVLIVPTRVQGKGAGEEVAAALRTAERIAGADLIVLARGGGSLEDLWAFNEEVVARAIHRSRLPVISAIGHEVDVTIADLVADRRALTPSEAAEICVPDLAEIESRLDHLRARTARAGRMIVASELSRLDRLADRARAALLRKLDQARHAVDRLADRPFAAIRAAGERRGRELAKAAVALEALSPLGVLARGYSLTTLEKGLVAVRDTHEIALDDRIRTRFARGSVTSRVIEIHHEEKP